MEKSDKKRILTRVLIVIAALTLLSCCFLGSTFARYVTSASGSGTVGVAKWDVSVTPSAEGTYKFSKLSPTVDGDKTQSTGAVDVVTVTNNGDVSALISYSVSMTPKFKSGYTTSDFEGQFSNVFSVEVTAKNGADLTLDAKSGDSIDSLTLQAEVIWKTLSDECDTWYGENLESITVTFTFTATQNSELPTAQP